MLFDCHNGPDAPGRASRASNPIAMLAIAWLVTGLLIATPAAADPGCRDSTAPSLWEEAAALTGPSDSRPAAPVEFLRVHTSRPPEFWEKQEEEEEVDPHRKVAVVDARRGMIRYTNTAFHGKAAIAHESFLPALDRLQKYADASGIEIHITSAFRRPSTNPRKASRVSNHLVGHALDFNLVYRGTRFTSHRLHPRRLGAAPVAVRRFISELRNDPSLEWGGDFRKADPVHVDDRLNARRPEIYRDLFRKIHVGTRAGSTDAPAGVLPAASVPAEPSERISG